MGLRVLRTQAVRRVDSVLADGPASSFEVDGNDLPVVVGLDL